MILKSKQYVNTKLTQWDESCWSTEWSEELSNKFSRKRFPLVSNPSGGNIYQLGTMWIHFWNLAELIIQKNHCSGLLLC